MMRLSALRLALFVTAVLSIVNAPAYASEPFKVEENDHADLTDLLYGELQEEWNRDLQVETSTLAPTSSPTPSPTLSRAIDIPSASPTSSGTDTSTASPTSSDTSVSVDSPTASPSPSVTSGVMKMAPYAAHAAVGMATLVAMALMS